MSILEQISELESYGMRRGLIKTALVSIIIGLLVIIAFHHHASAQETDTGSHFRYASLSWALTGNPGEVEFKLTAAFRRNAYSGFRCIPVGCSGADGFPIPGDIIIESQGPTNFNFGDGTITGTLRFLVTSVDVSSTNATERWLIGEALNPGTNNIGIRHTYIGAGPFTAYLAGFSSFPPGGTACCRIGQFGLVQLNNRSGSPYPIQTIVEPQSGNSSPVSSLVPVVSVPQNSIAQFLVPAADPDHDEIQFRMSTDLEAGGCCHPPNISVNPATGLVTWNTQGLSTSGLWTAQVVIEDLNDLGRVKSKGVVDFLLKIVAGNPPAFVSPTPEDGSAFIIRPGATFSFPVKAQDPDISNTVALNHGGLPQGATFTIPSASNPIQATFSWIPTLSDIGVHIVTFFATDNMGLSSLPRSIIIEVRPLTNIRLIDTISTSNIDLDSTSFSRQPTSITADTANNKTIIEWQFPSFSIGQIEDISFDVILKNPIPGEDRIVNHKLELLYTDVNGNPVRTELGPQSVHVLASAFNTTLSLDKTQYSANENVLIDLSITNLSEFGRTIDAIVEIKDSQGKLVKAVTTISGLAFAAGETKTFLDIIFNTGSTPAGDYIASVRLIEGARQVGEARAGFTVLSIKSATSRIVADKISYSSNEAVTLTSAVTSQSPNITLKGLTAKVDIIGPLGNPIFTETRTLPDLLPQTRYEFKSFTNTGINPSGSYTATLAVRSGGELLAISTTGFTILSSLDQAKALSGTISVNPATIFEKETTTLTYTAQNTGNDIDLPIIQIEILIVDPDTGIAIRTMFDETSLNGRELFQNSILFDSKGLPPKSYLVVLRGITAGITQTLDSTALIINPIPNSAPIADAGPDQLGFTGQSVSLDGTKSSDPDGDPISFIWHLVSVPEGSLITDALLLNAATPTPSFVPDKEGIYVIGLIVNDGLLSSQEDRVSVFVNPAPKVDIHPETINLKSAGGSRSITGILSSPLLSSFSFFTAPDGVTVTASFVLENRYIDKDGGQVVFTIPQEEYPWDDFVMASDSDGNGIDDTYTITLKFNRDLIIAGFKDQNGLLRITQPTDLVSTIIGNNIRVGSDTNLVISPPEVK